MDINQALERECRGILSGFFDRYPDDALRGGTGGCEKPLLTGY